MRHFKRIRIVTLVGAALLLGSVATTAFAQYVYVMEYAPEYQKCWNDRSQLIDQGLRSILSGQQSLMRSPPDLSQCDRYKYQVRKYLPPFKPVPRTGSNPNPYVINVSVKCASPYRAIVTIISKIYPATPYGIDYSRIVETLRHYEADCPLNIILKQSEKFYVSEAANTHILYDNK
jgi:hypothetical protein